VVRVIVDTWQEKREKIEDRNKRGKKGRTLPPER